MVLAELLSSEAVCGILINWISAGSYERGKPEIANMIEEVLKKANDYYAVKLFEFIRKFPSKEVQAELSKYLAKYLIEDVDFANQICMKMDETRERIEDEIKNEKNQEQKAKYLIILSDIYLFREESSKCLAALNEAKDIFEKLKDIDWNGQVLVKIGNYYNIISDENGENSKLAMSFYLDAWEMLKSSQGKNYWKSAIYNSLGNIYAKNEDYINAKQCYEEALKDQKNLRSEALLNLGNIYMRQGEFDEAIKKYNECLEYIGTSDSLTSLVVVKMASVGRANCCLEKANPDYKTAIESYGNCINTMNALGYKRGECIASMNLGTVFLKVGNLDKALEYYDKSLVFFPEINDHLLKCAILLNRGSVLRGLKKYSDSIESYNQADTETKLSQDRSIEQILPKFKAKSIEFQLLGNLGNVYLDQGDFSKAIDFYERALKEIPDEKEYYRDRVRLLMHLGVSQSNLDDNEYKNKARVNWDEAIRLLAAEKDTNSTEYRTIIEWKDKLRWML